MDQKTDAEIVARILAGDVQAYAQLVDAYKSPIYNLAFRMTGNLSDAEDLTQEIFIRSYQKLYQLDQEKKYFTWLYTIGINVIRSHIKKKNRDRTFRAVEGYYRESQLENFKENEGDLDCEDRMIMLEKTLLKLPVDVREAIILKYYQNMTFEEVADITGDSISTVKMRVYRGLDTVKKIMKKK